MSNTNSKHTPLPWKFIRLTNPKLMYWFSISGSNGDNVCKILRDDNDNTEQQTADAELIVKAVNSHEELVSALKKAKEELMHHILYLKNQNIFLEINTALENA